MVKLNYNGQGMLSFTHQAKDYIIYDKGPHLLPEDSELIKSLIAQGLLTEVQDMKLDTLKKPDLKTKKI